MSKNNNNICLECLECCKNISFDLEIKGSYYLYEQFAAIRNIKIITVKDNRVYFLLYHPCPQLTDEGCKIYIKRPEVCRIYDGRLDPALAKICQLPMEKI